MLQFLPGILFIGVGAYALVCTLKEYAFFWNNRKAQLMIKFMGRTGARIFYGTLGLAMIVIGIFILINKGQFPDF